MANVLYTLGKQKILNGDIDFDTDTIKAALVKNTYAQNLATDEFLDPALDNGVTDYRLNTDQTLTTPSIAGGVFDADDVTWTAVTVGDTAEAVVLYKDTGNPATSPLIAYLDTITGFPLATNGGNITVQWDNGAYKIFSL